MVRGGGSSAESIGRLEFVSAEMGLVSAEGNNDWKRWADDAAFPVIQDVDDVSALPFHVERLTSVFGVVEHHDGCLNRHPVARLHRT